jgi:hypothetical protein
MVPVREYKSRRADSHSVIGSTGGRAISHFVNVRPAAGRIDSAVKSEMCRSDNWRHPGTFMAAPVSFAGEPQQSQHISLYNCSYIVYFVQIVSKHKE